MAWIGEAPSLSALFSTYASVMASIMFLRSMINEFVPQSLRQYLESAFYYFFKPKSSNLTLVFEESTGMGTNQVFKAAECYLSTKISPETEKLKVSKISKAKRLTIQLEKGETVNDVFEGVELRWTFMGADEKQKEHDPDPISSYELCFLKKEKEMVLERYVPFVLERYGRIKDEERVLKMHSLSDSMKRGGAWWESIVLEHPSTFETLAMSPELKRGVKDDLDRFVKRKEFYKRVGRAWKRGYLLYGPPGTGKSSLVAAMANYLKFDVYDLQLANIMHDSDLRKLLLATANRSILVIEDIDCSVGLPNRLTEEAGGQNEPERKTQLTLSGLLNFIDGLWSSCGDERIIIFTTNHKEKLDPALLRPGRMDMHIHMSYCTFESFKLLASNYLGTSEGNPLYGEVEALIREIEVTPAQVAEEFMKSEDPDVALRGLLKLLEEVKMKKVEKRRKLEGEDLNV